MCTFIALKYFETLKISFLYCPHTCKWGRGCWRSSPCACGAAGNDPLSRTSSGWPSRSSPCEGSRQSSSPARPHPSFWLLHSQLLSSPLTFHPPPSPLQPCKELAVGRHHRADFWTHRRHVPWCPQSLGWSCSSWSNGLIQTCDTPRRRLCRADYFPPPSSQPHILESALTLWQADSRWWFMDVKIRVQEN